MSIQLSALRFALVTALPTTASQGDALIFQPTGVLYVYDGGQWVPTQGGTQVASLDDLLGRADQQIALLTSIDASLKANTGRL